MLAVPREGARQDAEEVVVIADVKLVIFSSRGASGR